MHLSLLFAVFALSPAAMAEEAGTVALVTGKVSARHGEIQFLENARMQFHDNYQQSLAPNDKLSAGDIIMTGENSYLKIYYRDNTVMDVGPDTTFKIVRFDGRGSHRTIAVQLLSGKIRSLVTQKLDAQGSYKISTPAMDTVARGTEFVVEAYQDQGQPKTDVTCLDGQVAVGSANPITVAAGERFSGTTMKHTLAHFNQQQMEEFAVIVPNGIAAAPPAEALPGTGSFATPVKPSGRSIASIGSASDPATNKRQALKQTPAADVALISDENTHGLTSPENVPAPPPTPGQARTEVRR